jgi:phosphoglucomutase
VETLTGFKYIGQKLGKYEAAIPASLRSDYAALSEEETRRLRLEHSSFYVFGGEESYGYSASDFVRDKDGNSAAVLIAEAAAYAKSQGLTLVGLLDRIFAEFGVYLERGESLTMDGAEGAAQRQEDAGHDPGVSGQQIAARAPTLLRRGKTGSPAERPRRHVKRPAFLVWCLADLRRFFVHTSRQGRARRASRPRPTSAVRRARRRASD